MRTCLWREMVSQARSLVGGGQALRRLAIQDSQRVGVDAASAVCTEPRFLLLEERDQNGQIGCSVCAAPETVHLQCQVRQRESKQKTPEERDHLDIRAGVRGAETFDTELVKLPEPSCLRALVAEHGTQVEIFLGEGVGREVMFDKGPHRSRCTLRSKRQRRTIPVSERIHFLLNDVSRGTDTPSEQSGDLEDRNTDLLKSVTDRCSSSRIFDETPARGLVREDVLDAFNTLDHGFICNRCEASMPETRGGTALHLQPLAGASRL